MKRRRPMSEGSRGAAIAMPFALRQSGREYLASRFALTAAIVVIGMTIYEVLEQVFFPGGDGLVTHMVHLLLSLFIAFIAVYAVSSRDSRLIVQLSEENRKSRESEASLHDSEERLRQITESIDCVFFLASPDLGRLFYVGPAYEKLTGRRLVDYAREPNFWREVIHPEDIGRMLDDLMDQGREEAAIEVRFIRADGAERVGLLRRYWVRNERGEIERMAGFVEDITERKRMENAVRESEARLRAFSSAIPDIAFIIDENGTYVEILSQPGAEDLLYERAEKIKGRTMHEVLPPRSADMFMSVVRKTIETGEPQVMEYVLDVPAGMRWFEGRTAPLAIPGGTRMAVWVSRDITRRKEADDDMRRLREHLEGLFTERTRELKEAKEDAEAGRRAQSDLIANMSHELTTPLNSIIGFSQVLQDGQHGDLNKNQNEYVSEILGSGRHLLNIITDILDLSRAESGEMELRLSRFLLRDALKSATAAIQRESVGRCVSVGFEMEPDADLEIEADSGKFDLIMSNLLSNAIKFTPDGGSVRVNARKAMTPEKSIEISVADTGIGLRSSDIPKLFEGIITQIESPYIKKHGGVGVGLRLTRRLVELHGGRIWVESELGRGSTFTFVMPVERPGAQAGS